MNRPTPRIRQTLNNSNYEDKFGTLEKECITFKKLLAMVSAEMIKRVYQINVNSDNINIFYLIIFYIYIL